MPTDVERNLVLIEILFQFAKWDENKYYFSKAPEFFFIDSGSNYIKGKIIQES